MTANSISRQQSKELTMAVAGEEDKKRRQAMDWLQSHAKLSSELWLPAKQRLLVVAGSGVLIEKRVCVKRAGQLLLLSLFSYSLHLQKLLVCRQTRRMLSSVHEQTDRITGLAGE